MSEGSQSRRRTEDMEGISKTEKEQERKQVRIKEHERKRRYQRTSISRERKITTNRENPENRNE